MSDAKSTLSAELLRELLDYDPATGNFVRRKNRLRRPTAGYVNPDGYRVIRIGAAIYKAHRLAWLYVHGDWPKHQIDHINGEKADNRIANLRDVQPAVNSENVRPTSRRNKTGLMGVKVDERRGRTFGAQICVRGQVIHLGAFPTPESAHAAYLDAKRRLHKGCTI